jgi:hypothetical protein
MPVIQIVSRVLFLQGGDAFNILDGRTALGELFPTALLLGLILFVRYVGALERQGWLSLEAARRRILPWCPSGDIANQFGDRLIAVPGCRSAIIGAQDIETVPFILYTRQLVHSLKRGEEAHMIGIDVAFNTNIVILPSLCSVVVIMLQAGYWTSIIRER